MSRPFHRNHWSFILVNILKNVEFNQVDVKTGRKEYKMDLSTSCLESIIVDMLPSYCSSEFSIFCGKWWYAGSSMVTNVTNRDKHGYINL